MTYNIASYYSARPSKSPSQVNAGTRTYKPRRFVSREGARLTVRKMIASASSAERGQRCKKSGRFFRSGEASKRDPEAAWVRDFPSRAISKGFPFDFIAAHRRRAGIMPRYRYRWNESRATRCVHHSSQHPPFRLDVKFLSERFFAARITELFILVIISAPLLHSWGTVGLAWFLLLGLAGVGQLLNKLSSKSFFNFRLFDE